jgi:hypothetical protein
MNKLGGRGECEYCHQWHNNVSYHREQDCPTNPNSMFNRLIAQEKKEIKQVEDLQTYFDFYNIIRKDEPPHYVHGEDCMGRQEQYWRQFLFCSDNKVVCGVALTTEEATKKANANRDLHEKFIRLSARQRVREILSNNSKYPCAQDQGELNRAFAELLHCI